MRGTGKQAETGKFSNGSLSATSEAPAISAPFLMLLFLLVVDYVGLGSYVGAVDTLKVPLITVVLLFAITLTKNGASEFLSYRQTKLFLVYMLLTALALFHGLISLYAFPILKQIIVYVLFMFSSFYLTNSRNRIDILSSFLVCLTVGLVLLNIDRVGAIRAGPYAAGFFMANGNDFAWALCVIIPFAAYWFMRSSRLLSRVVSLSMFFFLLLGIIATSSRGAFLSLLCMFLYLSFVISKKKTTGVLVLIVVGMVGVVVAPSNYGDRMQTIRTYEGDSSAEGRLKAWRTATEMAIDNPILGVGAGSFNSAYGRIYRREGDPRSWISTHSIYFKILAEYGFPGLAVYLWICFANVAMNRRTWSMISSKAELFSLDERWPRIINMSIIGYMVGGAFLSGVNYMHIFLLTTLTMATFRITSQEESIGRSSSI